MKEPQMLVVVLSVLASCAGAVFAEDEGRIDFELTADFLNKYIWRGQNLDDDRVFQPGLSATCGDLTVSIWGNMELTSINGSTNEFTELDYTLDYSSDFPGLDGVGYSLGLIYYDFPNTTAMDTTEAYWGLSFDLPLGPSVASYHDLDEAEGTYVSLGAGHSIEKIAELGPDVPVGLDIGASISWGSGSYNKYYWGTDQGKLNDMVLSASFPFELGGIAVTPSLSYITLVSDDIRDTDVYGTDSDFFLAGIGLLTRF